MDMYDNAITPDYSHIDSPQRAVRTALIDLGFEFEDNKFFFYDKNIGKIFYIEVKHLNSFDEVLKIIDEFMQKPGQEAANIDLLTRIYDRLKRLESRWMRRYFVLKAGGLSEPTSTDHG